MNPPNNENIHIYQQVNLFLDNQLEEPDRLQFLSHVENNNHYSKVLNQEQNFRTIFKERVNRREVPPTLIENIKNRIKG